MMPTGVRLAWEKPMRLLRPSLVVAALMASASTGHAQSAYDYPWCAVYTGHRGPGGAMSCYYRSYSQCMATMSGIGGYCIESPYYRGGYHDDRRRPRREYRNY